nr:hypothetical protein [Clostridia bacterium]
MQDKLPLWRRGVKAVLGALLTIVLLAAFYIAVIMGNPQESESSAITPQMDQPLLDAMSSPIMITQQSQLGALLDAFPGQVLAAMNSPAMTLLQGLCEDVPFENGLGRKVTLTYRTAEGAAVTVVSIYPARAMDLIPKADYTFSSTGGLTLAGLRSVRMENSETIRMHAQGENALYVVTLPKLPASGLRTLTQTLSRYQGD